MNNYTTIMITIGFHDGGGREGMWWEIITMLWEHPLPTRWTRCYSYDNMEYYYINKDKQQQQQQGGEVEESDNDTGGWNHIAEELDTWHGPIPAVVHGGESNMMVDDDDDAAGGMYYYYVNSMDGITSWEDPRVDAQLIHAIQVKVIQHLAHIFNIQQQQQPTAAMVYDHTYDDNATDSSIIIPGDLAAADDDYYDTPDFGSINDEDDDAAAAEILNLDDERCGNMTAPHDDEEEGEGVYYNNDGAIAPLHDVNYTYGDTVDITRDDGGDGILIRGRSGLSSDDNNINTVKRSKSMGPYNNKRSGSSLIRDTTVA
ncbi:hypothetical protein FOZ60_004967 [Perkinsus olseni]|uniref:WW domain-containing protein n=1 Tax=Perkinsus olseni TaxID=32597 RepID=A0A7J6NSD1_PEROL|nr:hypothetical protein FOZ60_004967 [Perkinsus olseni]